MSHRIAGRICFLIGLLALTSLTSPEAFAAKVSKATAKAALVEFDPIQENYAVGDKIIARLNGEEKALIEIVQIKNNRFIGRILKGTVTTEMQLVKQDVVTAQGGNASGTVDANAPVPNVVLPTVTILIGSMNVFHGVPQGRPLLFAGTDYYNSGLLAGFYFGNASTPATSEADGYVGYLMNMINWSAGFTAQEYTYLGFHAADTLETKVKITYRMFALETSYFPKYFSVDTSAIYTRASAQIGIGQKWKLAPWLSYTNFSAENKIGCRSYLDYKLGLVYAASEFNVEFAYSDTNRTDLNGNKLNDATAAAIISKTF